MFIRSVTKSVKNKSYIQHQLIESIRTCAGPRQRLVLNLGKIDIPKDQFKALANRIEEIITHQQNLFPCPDDVEALARHFADQIIQKRLHSSTLSSAPKPQKDYANLDLNSLAHSQARSLGGEHVALETIRQLDLPNLLKSLSFNDSQVIHAIMLIVARMISPGSERDSIGFIQNRSSLSELLDTDVAVYDNALHRAAVKLLENKDAIEQGLSKKTHNLFDLDETVFLYDLTNTYFEGSKAASQMAGFNRSKDRRHDRPLLTLALVVDQMGFPKQSRVLPGHCAEPKTIPHILDQLQDSSVNWLTREKTLVIDAGIASEQNLRLITDRGMHYVAVSRRRSYPHHFWDCAREESIPLADEKHKLTVRLVTTNKESFLLCRSRAKLLKEHSILERRQQRFEEAIALLNTNLTKKRTLKRYDKILEKVGRLKQQCHVGHLYDIDIQREDDVCTAISCRRKKSCAQAPCGEYVLRTDRTDLCANDISRIHRSLTTIEDCFRSMKGHLGLRPNFHHNDIPAQAHIFVTVLAYHILSVILAHLRAHNIFYNWSTIRSILSTHVRLTTTAQTDDQKLIHIRSNVRPEKEQTRIYNALRFSHNPIGAVKAIQTTSHKCSDENLPKKIITHS